MTPEEYKKFVYVTLAGVAAIVLVGFGVVQKDPTLIGWGLTVLAPGVVQGKTK